MPQLIDLLGRRADAAFALPRRVHDWLLIGPLLAYATPLLALWAARAAMGREWVDVLVREWIIPEIGPIEIPTFVLFVWAGVWAIRLAATSREQLGRPAALALSAFGAGLLLVAGEEASWGQWFLAFETPEAIAEVNHQGELNVHNIVLQGKTEIMRALFGLLGLGVVFLAPRLRAFASLSAPRALAPWFMLMTTLPLWELATDYVVLMRGIDGYMRSKLYSEIQELIIAASAVVYVWIVSRRSRA